MFIGPVPLRHHCASARFYSVAEGGLIAPSLEAVLLGPHPCHKSYTLRSPRFICLTKYQSRRRKSSNCASSNCFEAFGCSFVTAGEDFSFAASVSARRLSGLGAINTVSQGYRVFFINPFICLIRPAQHRVYSRASVIPFSGTRRVPHPVVLVRPGLQSVMSVSATRDVLQRLKVPNFDT